MQVFSRNYFPILRILGVIFRGFLRLLPLTRERYLIEEVIVRLSRRAHRLTGFIRGWIGGWRRHGFPRCPLRVGGRCRGAVIPIPLLLDACQLYLHFLAKFTRRHTALQKGEPFFEVIGFLGDTRGLLDHRELVEPPLDTPDQPRVWNVSCQGGLFRVRGRRLSTRSDADQQRRSPGDRFYSETAKMVGRPLNWSKAPGNIPGKATGSGSSATGGSSGSSGGSTGIIAGVGKYGSRV